MSWLTGESLNLRCESKRVSTEKQLDRSFKVQNYAQFGSDRVDVVMHNGIGNILEARLRPTSVTWNLINLDIDVFPI
jgi:hypothetical protein